LAFLVVGLLDLVVWLGLREIEKDQGWGFSYVSGAEWRIQAWCHVE